MIGQAHCLLRAQRRQNACIQLIVCQWAIHQDIALCAQLIQQQIRHERHIQRCQRFALLRIQIIRVNQTAFLSGKWPPSVAEAGQRHHIVLQQRVQIGLGRHGRGVAAIGNRLIFTATGKPGRSYRLTERIHIGQHVALLVQALQRSAACHDDCPGAAGDRDEGFCFGLSQYMRKIGCIGIMNAADDLAIDWQVAAGCPYRANAAQYLTGLAHRREFIGPAMPYCHG